jgi:hypothetical protein
MKTSITVKDAESQLKTWIEHNCSNFDEYTEHRLNREIINLSHDVFLSRGWKGHIVRQNVRRILADYAKAELAEYGMEFRHPLKTERVPPAYQTPRKRFYPHGHRPARHVRHTIRAHPVYRRSSRYSYYYGHHPSSTLRKLLIFILKILGFVVLVYIILYIFGLV